VELSASQETLAFRDVEGRIFLTDLSTLDPKNIGVLSDACTADCFQFQ